MEALNNKEIQRSNNQNDTRAKKEMNRKKHNKHRYHRVILPGLSSYQNLSIQQDQG